MQNWGDISGDTNIHIRAKATWQQNNLRTEVLNSHKNYELLDRMRTEGRVQCLSEVPVVKDTPAIIMASGSSLDAVLPTLAQWKGGVFCSTSHATTLMRYDVPKFNICCVDPNEAYWDEWGVPGDLWDRGTFITNPSGPPGYFKFWFEHTKGENCILFRILEPNYDWYTHYLKWTYPWVQYPLLPFIDACAMQVGIASVLGYDPIYLAGVDYGGPRYTGVHWRDGGWHDLPTSGDVTGEIAGPGGLLGNDVMLYSMRGVLIGTFLQMASRRATRIYQLSPKSNVYEFPYKPWEEVLEAQGRAPEWTAKERQQVRSAVEVELAKSDTWMVPVEGGFGTDYRVYMSPIGNLMNVFMEISKELVQNKFHFAQLEQQFNAPLRKLIEDGMILVDKGEMLVHPPADYDHFNWRTIAAINVEAMLNRSILLKAEAEKRTLKEKEEQAVEKPE